MAQKEPSKSKKKESRILRTPEEICKACNEFREIREAKLKEERQHLIAEFLIVVFVFCFCFLVPRCF